MNIFALDANPKYAAKYHCDKHVIKMILESCQLLSTAHRVLDGIQTIRISNKGRKIKVWRLNDSKLDSFIYSATHINHPSAIWCRQTKEQYLWLAQLTLELCKEYTYRYGKTHKCQAIGLVDWFNENTPQNIPSTNKFVLPTPAMPEHCKVPGDVVASYRNYYLLEKQHMLSWKGKINSAEIPIWVLESDLYWDLENVCAY